MHFKLSFHSTAHIFDFVQSLESVSGVGKQRRKKLRLLIGEKCKFAQQSVSKKTFLRKGAMS